MAVSHERSAKSSHSMAITQAKYIYHGCWSMIWIIWPYFVTFVWKKVIDIDWNKRFQAQNGSFFNNMGSLMPFFWIFWLISKSKGTAEAGIHLWHQKLCKEGLSTCFWLHRWDSGAYHNEITHNIEGPLLSMKIIFCYFLKKDSLDFFHHYISELHWPWGFQNGMALVCYIPQHILRQPSNLGTG